MNREALNQFLTVATQNNASDVHLQVGEQPLFRIHGQLTQVKYHPLSPSEMTEIVETLVGAEVISYDRAVAQQSPELSRQLGERIQAQFCAMHDHVVLLGRKSALERVASFVMHCVPGRGVFNCPGPGEGEDSVDIPLGMTRHEIADYLGLTLETVSRVFSEFRRRGIVMIDGHERVHVNDVCQMCLLTGAHEPARPWSDAGPHADTCVALIESA